MAARQMPTEPDDRRWNLSVQQQAAADLLALGNNVTTVAEQVGVARQTVSEWLNQNRAFEAAVNQRRQELWDNATNRLRALLPDALEVLAQGLKGGSIKAAIEVLKAAGLHGLHKPEGPTNPQDAESAAKEKERARQDRALFAGLLG
jgi:transposase-like protein